MNTYALFAELDGLPTLAQDQSSNLKYDDGETRLWCPRGVETGYTGPPVIVERLEDGRWRAQDQQDAGAWAETVSECLERLSDQHMEELGQ